jgi:acyl-CoA synthetase (AMP-forming)/AMP-acid ligase II
MTERGSGISAATLPALVRLRSAERGHNILYVGDEERLSFLDADERSAALSQYLLVLGVGRGTRVGLMFPNSVEFIVFFLAAVRIGAVVVPLSTLATPDELRWQLANADVEILICVGAYRSRNFLEVLAETVPTLDLDSAPPILSQDLPSLRRIFFCRHPDGASEWSFDSLRMGGQAISDRFLRCAEAVVSPSDTAIIVHTSGSTSLPKGVLHTQGALVQHVRNLNAVRRFSSQDVLFSNSPFFWIGGLVYCLLGALDAGARLVCSTAASAQETLDLLERECPTIVIGFPASVAHLQKDPTYARRHFSARRGNMPAVMAQDARPDDPQLRHNILGTTETASVYLIDADEGPLRERLRGSFGRPAPGFEVQIVNPSSGEVLPAGQIGEIRVRGPYVMEGYVGRERHETFEPDGWYRTGDLAYVNEDDFVFYQGRLGDMIKTAGANVSPREVENVINAITGRPVHVFGIPDADKGQIVVAAVVVEGGAPLDESELRQQLKQKISSYKIPRRFLFLTEAQVPMMSSGKLDRRQLAQMFFTEGPEDD